MMSGTGGLDEVRGDQGGGRCWRRKSDMAAVVTTSGIVAASILEYQLIFQAFT